MSMGKKNSKSRSRNKRRKPKFLSLSLEINSEKKSQPLDQMRHVTSTDSTRDRDREENQQLNLFPLHPENLVDEKEENNVALFFSGTENTDTSLTGLLTCSKDEGDSNNNGFDYMTVSTSEASLSYADTYRGQQGALVRTALRSKERENGEEEKWVVYSDVVDCDQHSETRKDEEVSSCSTDHPARNKRHNQQKNLSLKLDYEEILNAWSDKGSLYLHQSDSSQIVPDIHDDFLPYDTLFSSQGLMYRVPEVMGSEGRATENLQEDELKVGRSREASVLRYKEKRQNRLFAKRIRYEVRKLNAEKRPRVKGRFVKRN